MNTKEFPDLQVFPVPQHTVSRSTHRRVRAIAPQPGAPDDWAASELARRAAEIGLDVLPGGGVGEMDVLRVSLTSDAGTLASLCERSAREFGADCTAEALGQDGYVLSVTPDKAGPHVVIAAPNGSGQAYGVDTLVQILAAEGGPAVPDLLVFDYPAVKMRVYGGPGTDDHAAALRFNIRRKSGTAEENAEMKRRHIAPVAALHPSHATEGKPGLCYSDAEAVTEVLAPLVKAAEAGAEWVMISFDDIDLRLGHPEDVEAYGTIGEAHVAFVNEAARRVREVNPTARVCLIPIVYANNWFAAGWVYATREDEVYDYLDTVGWKVDPSVVFVWTGESVESVSMTADDVKQWVDLARRKPLVFENTPTGDPDDLGALKMRTTDVGELLEGWIYIHRGPKAEVAEYTTAEFLWNPKAYDRDAALSRAVRRIAGDEAAPHLERLVRVFSRKPEGTDPRYFNPLWRDGRLLEVTDPDNARLADYYVDRLQTVSETLPVLDGMIPDVPFYQTIRQIALSTVDVSQAYLETFVFVKSIEAGDVPSALAAGDRAEALHQDWMRYSTGSTNLTADTDRRDSLTYIEQVDVAGKLRALRRGGGQTIHWVVPAYEGKKGALLGRSCVFPGQGDASLRLAVHSLGRDENLILSGCGPAGAEVSVTAGGEKLTVENGLWRDDRWVSVPVRLPDGAERFDVVISADPASNWGVARVAVIQADAPARLLHAVRSACGTGEAESIEAPERLLVSAQGPGMKGRMAVRTDLENLRGASGSFYDLRQGTRIGQTFHLPGAAEETVSPKDHVHLHVRESRDGDFLRSLGVMFTQQGEKSLSLSLWKWAGSVVRTVSEPTNRVLTTPGAPGSPFGPSRHWVEFPCDAELDMGATYYAEITAPEGWAGWRLRRSFGWYGYRGDETRSAYLNGEIERGVDIPFRTYVLDVYDAEWDR